MNIETELSEARALRGRGADEAALALYMRIVSRVPTHLAALTELGELAYAAGYRSAARTAYEQVVKLYPNEALGHVNLATVLSASQEYASAKAHFLAALQLRPDDPAAHRGLSLVLAEEGDDAGAAEHARRGFGPEPSVEKPYRGTGTASRVLLLVSARGGNIPVDLWLNDRRYHVTALYAEYCDLTGPLAPHDLVVNAIGDADLCGEGLAAAATIVARTDRPVINRPELILPTGRVAQSSRLGDIEGLRAPRTARQSIDDLRSKRDLAFPMLLRRPGFHTGQHFRRIEDRIGFISALDAFAAEGATELLAIEYLDARGRDGRARKYRVMFIDGRPYPLHLAISDDWKVHYFSSAMADDPAFRTEEAAFLENPQATIGPRGWTALGIIAARIGLEYAGIDFGLAADGTLLLFECNATMVLLPASADPIWNYRRPAIDRAFAAVEAMMTRRLRNNSFLPRAHDGYR